MTDKTRRARMVEHLTEMGVPLHAGILVDSLHYSQIRADVRRAGIMRRRRLRKRGR